MKVFVLIKPNDGIAKAGKIIRTYERDGWRVLKITYRTLYRDFAEIHYINLKNEEYYKELIENICSGPVIGLELEQIYTNSVEAAVEIMYDLRRNHSSGSKQPDKLVDCSESEEEANRLIHLWFD